MSARVSRWLLLLVAVFYGFRFAIDWYRGPSIAWGFAYTALGALLVYVVIWQWGRQLARFLEWLWSLLPYWLRGRH